jgi:conjugal transfer/type IV secretion protein DotA/TraY
MLRRVFGSIIDHLAGSTTAVQQTIESSMLAAAIGYFNSGVLFFGSILLTWVTVTGAAHTANDGEALGKRWSSMWTPIRTIGGTASLLPLASGYSVVQAFVLTVVIWGVGLASGLWEKVTEYATVGSVVDQAMASVVDDENFNLAALAAVRMTVCARAAEKMINAAVYHADGSQEKFILSPYTDITTAADGSQIHRTIYRYDVPTWPGAGAACGDITVTNKFITTSGSNDIFSDQLVADTANAISMTQTTFLQSLFNGQLDPIAQQIMDAVDNNSTIFPS